MILKKWLSQLSLSFKRIAPSNQSQRLSQASTEQSSSEQTSTHVSSIHQDSKPSRQRYEEHTSSQQLLNNQLVTTLITTMQSASQNGMTDQELFELITHTVQGLDAELLQPVLASNQDLSEQVIAEFLNHFVHEINKAQKNKDV